MTEHDAEGDVTVLRSTIESIESNEYEFSARAEAEVDGPDGRLRVRREYDAFPRHNDDIAPGAIDSNDSTMAPDELHVHSRFYAVGPDLETTTYLTDRHETCSPSLETLADPSKIRSFCRADHERRLASDYEWAIERRVHENR